MNYEPAADNFDGSCEYEGQIVGSTSTTQYWTGAPDCGDNASITITKDMGKSTSLAATYEVVDDWGDTWWSGVLNFEANTCLQLELTL